MGNMAVISWQLSGDLNCSRTVSVDSRELYYCDDVCNLKPYLASYYLEQTQDCHVAPRIIPCHTVPFVASYVILSFTGHFGPKTFFDPGHFRPRYEVPESKVYI